MKKAKFIILSLILIFTLFIGVPAFANMAAPREDDIASGITFERSNELEVLSEVLDIKIEGPKAKITATYNMKNTLGSEVTTKSMFISPNIDESSMKVLMNDKALEYENETYYIKYDTKAKVEEWKFVLENIDEANDFSPKVDTVSFNMSFKPNEEAVVSLSYIYSLGGYPTYDFDVKRGSLTYYLSPASMWKNYGGITINLELDKDMPVLKESNIEFKKLKDKKYQYVSDTLPASELELKVDQTPWQEFISSFNSPYLLMNLAIFAVPALIIIAIIVAIAVVVVVRKKKRHNKA